MSCQCSVGLTRAVTLGAVALYVGFLSAQTRVPLFKDYPVRQRHKAPSFYFDSIDACLIALMLANCLRSFVRGRSKALAQMDVRAWAGVSSN